MAEPLRILMLCLGNICRSPLAEGALRAQLQAAGLEHRLEVDSAGIGGWHVGQPPDPRAIACAARHGVEIGGLRARRLSAADFFRFDHLLCADAGNVDAARFRAPDARVRARVRLLADYALGASDEVPDPYHGDDADFERVWNMLERMACAIVAKVAFG